MTAEEIRKESTDVLGSLKFASVPEAIALMQARMLAEIASQLAQLNAGMDYLTSSITGDGMIRIRVEPGQYPIEVNTNQRN